MIELKDLILEIAKLLLMLDIIGVMIFAMVVLIYVLDGWKGRQIK